MHRSLPSIVAVLLVLAAGLPLWRWVSRPEPPAVVPPRDLGPVPVAAEEVRARELVLEVEARGNLEPARRVGLAFERSGRLATVARWSPGAHVAEGELLATLETHRLGAALTTARARRDEATAARAAAEAVEASARAALTTAEESLAVATRELARVEELGERGAASASVVDRARLARLDARAGLEGAEAALRQATANVALAEARVELTLAGIEELELELMESRLVAPFAGRLVGPTPTVGALVGPGAVGGQLLGELVDDRVVLRARVPERDLPRLAVGRSARVRVPALPETRTLAGFDARVVAVDPVADPRTRRALVELELEGTGAGTRAPAAGLFAEATIEVERLPAAVWIARRHLRWRGADAVAFVLEEHGGELVARERTLELLHDHGEGFVVGAGLAVGERLLVEPLDRLHDGARCRLRAAAGEPR